MVQKIVIKGRVACFTESVQHYMGQDERYGEQYGHTQSSTEPINQQYYADGKKIPFINFIYSSETHTPPTTIHAIPFQYSFTDLSQIYKSTFAFL